ncbi:MAG TPA: hypothetical protein VFS77_22835 [Pyrinomonadaceae bacterium]|nr:hypothetical protein [Pyrinomonadaceae bacterium]
MNTDLDNTPSPAGDSSVQYGIGGYNTISNMDLMFALDYKSVGKVDHPVVYRPGSGIVWILENQNDPTDAATYQPVYHTGFPDAGTAGQGIGGYPLTSTADRMFAFDYDCTGKLDDLFIYCPGEGKVCILQNSATTPGTFTVALNSTDGIGTYNLTSPADRVFAFDLEGSGMMDDLVLYRPGTGIIWILQNDTSKPGNFTVAYNSGLNGIGGYNLTSTSDRAFAFDYEGSGKADDLALYRPGAGIFWIIQNQHSNPASFKLPYPTPPAEGIGGYDLLSPLDQVFAFDYESNGNLDDLVLFRAGQGTVWVLQNDHAAAPAPPSFTRAFQQTGNPPYTTGIGDFDLFSTNDLGFAFDFSGVGHMDYLCFYRPGTGAISFLENNRTSPATFSNAPYQAGLSSVDQVGTNLSNLIALNTTLGAYAQQEIMNAYVLLTGSKDNNTSWAETVGLQVLGGVFWAIAGIATGGVAPAAAAIMGATAGFIASFAPGMIQAWVQAGAAPTIPDVSAEVSGLITSFGDATGALNKQLGDYENDVQGSWFDSYPFNGTTTYVNGLASIVVPVGGPVYDALNTAMSASYLKQIWQTILVQGYVICPFDSCSCNPVDDSFYDSYYAKNPAYFVTYDYVTDVMSFSCLGTGISEWWPLGSDNALNIPTCNYFFATFDRTDVFTNWGIPSSTSGRGDTPPGPHPPGASFPN